VPESELLAFARVVFDAAVGGDAVAVALVERLADEVLDYVRALVHRMSLATAEVDVVLGGSALQSANPVLLARLTAHLSKLAPGARLVVLDVAPVAGAVAGALRMAGADPGAVAAARSSLRWS
jgi:N-acetylglucosamine kinase-like BadF-type ATPase